MTSDLTEFIGQGRKQTQEQKIMNGMKSQPRAPIAQRKNGRTHVVLPGKSVKRNTNSEPISELTLLP